MAFLDAFLWASLYFSLFPWTAILGSICLACLISIAVFHYTSKDTKKKLPPLVSLSNQEVIDAFRSGKMHEVEKQLMAQYGSVYRMRSYGEKNGIFVLNSPSALRKMLDEDGVSDKVRHSF